MWIQLTSSFSAVRFKFIWKIYNVFWRVWVCSTSRRRVTRQENVFRTSIEWNFISRDVKMRIFAREACVKPHFTHGVMKSHLNDLHRRRSSLKPTWTKLFEMFYDFHRRRLCLKPTGAILYSTSSLRRASTSIHNHG